MLAIPPFGAGSNIALWRADNKPPLEVVVANLDSKRYTALETRLKWHRGSLYLQTETAKKLGIRMEGENRIKFKNMVTQEEAERYDKYWSQKAGSYRNIKLPDGTKKEAIFQGEELSTRQRLQVSPGTRSIVDVKYGKTGEMYRRETIFDEYG